MPTDDESDNDCDDYMSDKFLNAAADVRPSLVQNRAKKRQLEVEAKQEASAKKQREERAEQSCTTRNERLQESLSKPIEASNKGFQLLAKMGYKPTAAATNTPIGISLKEGRGGLGREAAVAELKASQARMRRERLLRAAGAADGTAADLAAYRQRAAQRVGGRRLLYDLSQCQKTCETLDQAAGLSKPDLPYFWPCRQVESESDDDSDDDSDKEEPDELAELPTSDAEQLELLTNYLRTAYLFCYWCGTRYDSADDLRANCPGPTEDDH